MANPSIGEITATTIRNRSRKLADNVSVNTALLYRLNERGKIRPVSGGETILQELEYAENSTYKRYSGYELLDISPSVVFTAAEYPWRQVSVAVSISGLEELKNSGPERMIDLLEARIGNAERTFMNNMSEDVYSDGTADGGKQVDGIQQLVSVTPTTGVVGGIDRATWTFWRNQVTSADITGSNVQSTMNGMWLKTKRNADKVDLIAADNDMYTLYWESLQPQQRFHNSKLAEAGFDNLKFQSADVIPDGGLGGKAPAKTMYFLNCNYIHYRPHRDRNMVPLDPDRFSVNQDAMVKLIGWAGNMTLSNASLQGVIRDSV